MEGNELELFHATLENIVAAKRGWESVGFYDRDLLWLFNLIKLHEGQNKRSWEKASKIPTSKILLGRAGS